MSEAAQKVESLKHIAVFPLPLVLLPGEVVPLHIFEPRYQQMLIDIEAERNLFGICLFEANEGFTDHPEPGTVGCVAEVREAQPLPDGRSNITTLGVIRFRILNYLELGSPYLTVEAEFFEDAPDEDEALTAATAEEVFGLFERVARAAFDLSGTKGPFPEIQRSDPERLSFLVTAAFNFENNIKYELLEMRSTIARLDRLLAILRSAVDRMEDSAALHKVAQTNGHSKTKIEF